jgi:hypothetical protein
VGYANGRLSADPRSPNDRGVNLGTPVLSVRARRASAGQGAGGRVAREEVAVVAEGGEGGGSRARRWGPFVESATAL